MRRYYLFSVMLGLFSSLSGLVVNLFSKDSEAGVGASLFWIAIFFYAFFKRNEVLESAWKKWVFIGISSLFLVGWAIAMFLLITKN